MKPLSVSLARILFGGLLASCYVLYVGTVMVPDGVAQIIEQFEDGPCLLGGPFGTDEESHAAIETGRLLDFPAHGVGSISPVWWPARC